MKTYSSDKIKNVLLAGHGGSGKTSLAEAILFCNGVTDRLGKVSDGNTVMDYDQEEIKRLTSVSLSMAPIEVRDHKINILDAPGSFDFIAGLYEGIQAVETVLITLSGKSGVTPGAELAYDLAKQHGKSTAFFVSKLDNESADFYKVYDMLKQQFGSSVCPFIIPYVENRKVVCYVDVIGGKAFSYDSKGKATPCDMPDVGDLVDEIKNSICEAVAETDEALLDKFFAGEQFSESELITGIKNGITQGVISPVFAGSSTTLDGIDYLLNSFINLFPSPKDVAPVNATDKNGDSIEIKCDENAPLAAYIYKTVADPFIGKLSFVKVLSGRLKADSQPVTMRLGEPERIGKIIFLRGKKQEDTKEVVAGDIAALAKLGEVVTGDTLCHASRVVTVPMITYPNPCMSMAIRPKSKGDEGKISGSMQRLTEEDTTLRFATNTETHEQVITGLGDQHLDVAISKLKSKFGIDVELSEPIVPYRETIRKKVRVEGKHKKQTGGHGQFGHVWIEFEPFECSDLTFEEKVFGGSVPKGFFPAVEKGLRDSIKRGTIAGYPMVSLKATLVDGSYHPVDSSEMSFKMAASMAFRNGIPQATPILLEPIGNLKVKLPDANTGDLMGDINKRRGRILGMNPSGKLQEIEAEVPLSEMHDFTTVLRSMTQGRGSFTFEFTRYEQLPAHLEKEVIANAPKRESENI